MNEGSTEHYVVIKEDDKYVIRHVSNNKPVGDSYDSLEDALREAVEREKNQQTKE